MIVTPEDVPPDMEGKTAVRVIDGNNCEWERLQWVNIKTGQAMQMKADPTGGVLLRNFLDEDGKTQTGIFSHLIRLPLPIRFEFLGGERDGAEWKPYVEGTDSPAEG